MEKFIVNLKDILEERKCKKSLEEILKNWRNFWKSWRKDFEKV